MGGDTYQMPGSLGPLTSPTICLPLPIRRPASYDIHVNIGTLKEGFGALHGDGSYVWMFDFILKRINK